eukprot:SAG11_NODE_12850_length_682_cov_1.346484_1_plen_58_part_10
MTHTHNKIAKGHKGRRQGRGRQGRAVGGLTGDFAKLGVRDSPDRRRAQAVRPGAIKQL